MKYLFILGRNIELSKAEVFSYFEREENRILSQDLIKNGLLLDLEKSISEKIVDKFGGVVSIGEVVASGTQKEIFKNLDSRNLYSGIENKLNYVVWNFSSSYENFVDYLKKRFKSEKLKATFKHLTGKIEMQGEGKILMPSSKLIDEEFFIFGEKEIYFGRIFEKYDSEALEARDMNKPVRRESLAISPRLAKILINLSQVKKSETLLDPFCGIGTVLTEALLQGIKVVGIDKDKNAVLGARQNLEWSGFSEDNYKLFNADSTNKKIDFVNGVATEPDLGEILRKTPTEKEAKKQLKDFENLIIKFLKNLKTQVSGRVAFTTPYIRVFKKRHKCNISRILEETGYKMIYEIPEYRKNQIVGRMIYVLDR